MGILLSVYISYVGIKEAVECMKNIISGVVPTSDPNFDDLVEYYTRLQRKTANPPAVPDWANDCGQGYVVWTEDKDGNFTSGAIKFHGTPSNSTALLFSTKISSFGQYSVDETPQENGDYRTERYPLTKTKTIISDTSESFSVGSKNKSISATPNHSFERDYNRDEESKSKLTWQYTPKSPSPLPEIHFQSYDDEKRENITYSEDFLRSLDGIKFRPLQRSDPSGRRRSFRKRFSSSSNSSKESRESREEELKMFTSLEEAEFSRMNDKHKGGFGSTPNLAGRSYSRSRSREKSKDRGDENENTRADYAYDNTVGDAQSKDLPRLSTFEETVENNDKPEVNEEQEEVDFWANIGD